MVDGEILQKCKFFFLAEFAENLSNNVIKM